MERPPERGPLFAGVTALSPEQANRTTGSRPRHAAQAQHGDASLFVEGRVDDAVAVGGPVRFVGHADHSHQLAEHGFGYAGHAGARGMAGDAISAATGRAHGEINHLLGDGIERARRHDLLEPQPRALESGGVVPGRQSRADFLTCRTKRLALPTVFPAMID
jgi:hypothetical protein